MKRRVRASLVVMLGFQAGFLVVTLAVGRVGAVKIWLIMMVGFLSIYIIYIKTMTMYIAIVPV